MRKFLISLLLFFSVAAFCFVQYTELTTQRIALTQKLFDQIVNSAETLPSNAEIYKLLLAELKKNDEAIAKFDPNVPCHTDVDARANSIKQINESLDAKYPPLSDADLDRLAAERYPLYKENTKIKVFYYSAPKKVSCLHGYFKGSKGGSVIIEGKRIPFRDMKGIVVNDPDLGRVDNAEEIIKLNPTLNAEKRQAYRDELAENRKRERQDWHDKNDAIIIEQQNTIEGKFNENAGYTQYNGTWLAPENFVRAFVLDAIARHHAKMEEKKNQEIENAAKAAEGQLKAIIQIENFAPLKNVQKHEQAVELKRVTAKPAYKPLSLDSFGTTSEDATGAGSSDAASKVYINENGEAGGVNSDSSSNADGNGNTTGEDTDSDEDEDSDEDSENGVEKNDNETPAAKSKKFSAGDRTPTTEIVEEEGGSNFNFILFGIVLVAIGLGFGVYMWLHHRSENELDVSDFFEGEGEEQKLFWEAAKADPTHFTYVAYLYPNEEEATNALLSLSYIYIGDRDNQIHSTKNIRFGLFNHKEGVVCYVGGENLHYALWREASAVWPELPGATYFKVSQEPQVRLNLPNLDSFDRSQIQDLGAEDTRNENGEIIRVYKYRATSVEMAIKFIEKFQIQEEGISICVETPTCKYGKDANGIFEIKENN